MLVIDSKNNIRLTRGDTAKLTLTVLTLDSQTYDYSNDLTQFTVKRNTVTEEIIFQKTFTGNTIIIDPEDTKELYYTDLKYDVQLITPDSEVYTVIAPADFIIEEEVNFNVSRS